MLTVKYLIKKVNTILLKVKSYNLGVDNIHYSHSYFSSEMFSRDIF